MHRGRYQAILYVNLLAFSICAGAQGQHAGSGKLEFSERVVAGGQGSFMTVRHLKLRGSQSDIGAKLAQIARERHGVKPVTRDTNATRDRQAFYKSEYPSHFQRSLGVRESFGVALGDSTIDASLLPYNMPAQFACSVVYYPPSHTASGHAMLSRNYDWSTGTWVDILGPEAKNTKISTEDPYVLEIYPDEGYASLSLCAYELLGGGLDGINSQGLSIALLANATEGRPTPSNEWRGGLSEIEIVRFVLENCATVDDAKRVLEEISFYYLVVPCHYIIGDRSGDSFVWEYSADLSQRHSLAGGGNPQWVTNHPVHLYPTAGSIPAGKKSPSNRDCTFRRFDRLHDEIAKVPKKRTDGDIKFANLCVSDRDKTDAGSRTLWHSLYDCADGSLEIDFYLGENAGRGGQKRSGYLRF